MSDLSSLSFLVTGGAGFIGSNLVEHLLSKNARRVRILDDFSTGRRKNIAPFGDRIEVLEGDLRDPSAVRNAVEGIDYVLHQGAIPSVPRSVDDPLLTTEVNIGGTVNILTYSARAGVKRVVFASSSSVYGDTPELPKHEDMPLRTLSPYAASKGAGELYCRSFSEVMGMEAVCLRYFNIFGPRQDPASQYAAAIPRFVAAILKDQPVPIYGDGLQTRDFTYIDNVVHANLAACFADGVAGRSYNIGCGERITVLELAQGLADVLGKELRVEHLPPRPGDVRDSLASIERSRDELGYRPMVKLREGLKRTVDYFKKELAA